MKHYSLLGLAPLTLYLGAFTVVPVVSTLVLSFRTPEGDWGLGAFHALAAHYQFGEAVVNTLAITGLGLVIELSLGLAAPPGQTTFQLSDGDPNVPNTQTFDNVAPGSGYSVSETVPSGSIRR